MDIFNPKKFSWIQKFKGEKLKRTSLLEKYKSGMNNRFFIS